MEKWNNNTEQYYITVTSKDEVVFKSGCTDDSSVCSLLVAQSRPFYFNADDESNKATSADELRNLQIRSSHGLLLL